MVASTIYALWKVPRRKAIDEAPKHRTGWRTRCLSYCFVKRFCCRTHSACSKTHTVPLAVCVCVLLHVACMAIVFKHSWASADTFTYQTITCHSSTATPYLLRWRTCCRHAFVESFCLAFDRMLPCTFVCALIACTVCRFWGSLTIQKIVFNLRFSEIHSDNLKTIMHIHTYSYHCVYLIILFINLMYIYIYVCMWVYFCK